MLEHEQSDTEEDDDAMEAVHVLPVVVGAPVQVVEAEHIEVEPEHIEHVELFREAAPVFAHRSLRSGRGY